MQGRKDGMLWYGAGCHLHPDCFTCPGPPQCVVQYGANKKEQRKTKILWLPVFEKELSRGGGKG